MVQLAVTKDCNHHSKRPSRPSLPNTRVRSEAGGDRFERGPEPRLVQMTYLPQDPGMFELAVGEVESTPELRNERFQVSVGNGFPMPHPDADGNFLLSDQTDPRMDAVNCFYVANQTLKMAEEYAGGRIDWSFQETLGHPMLIRPHAGKNVMNAFYSSESGSLNFFSYQDEKTGDIKRTGMNRDIIAHETGHAILDALRPHLINQLSVGAGGFHEAFGDMTAMLSALHDPAVVEAMRLETKGDVSRSNVVSRLAEEMGTAAFERGPLREAVNKNRYADQAFLPYSDDENPATGLGTECHSYANLFNGAFYELFATFFNQIAAVEPGRDFASTVADARDKVGKLLYRAVEMGPVGDMTAREAAMAFLRADLVDNGGDNVETLKRVFLERKMLRPEDAEAVVEAQRNLPDVRLDQRLEDRASATEWLNENASSLGLPEGVEWEWDRVRTNDRGEKFVTFTTSRSRILQGPDFGDYEGSQIQSMGGVLLGFDADGQLFTHQYDEVSDRELEDITNFFRQGVQMGNIARATGQPESFGKSHRPRLQVESVTVNGRRVLRRSGMV